MIRKFARPMLASAYVADGIDTLVNPSARREDAESVLKKARTFVPPQYRGFIPDSPETAALAVGGVKVGAGSLFALGKMPRLSATLLAAATVPSLLGRHAFWESNDDQEKARRRNGALTDLSLLGGVLLASVDTAGKPGLAWRVQKALPTQSETEKAMSKAGNWISDATDQVTSYVDDNKDDWKKTAANVADSASDFLSTAAEQAQSTYNDVKPSKLQQAAAKRKVNGFVSDLQSSLNDLQPSATDKFLAKRKANKAASKLQDRAQSAVDVLQSAFDNLDAAPSKREQRKWKRKANKAQKRASKAVNKAIKKYA
ncbi:DoxX family protein [Corynebacterium sp.]|uniref:DoxX family protein n=1 Tax=Corynebacterium sp. TaxID=1720 RepID=UPI002A912764|nr:DoxX family protein [Corynebacterium sp.]MDY5785304.1 DoxX family protein [Corynebacterium sp.]